MSKVQLRPACRATKDDNMYYILGAAYTALCEKGKEDQAKMLVKQVENSRSFGEALTLISMYVKLR